MDDSLRKLQLTQLEILKVFDQFCRTHELHYSLYAGSLLGAIRHKGFIPWDDDLDVCMAREEYDRFITLWTNTPVPGYVLQNKENSPSFTQSFTKLRKDHTTFLQYDWEAGRYHTGIFLDIFPLDRLPNGAFARKQYQWNCMVYQLLTREFVPQKAHPLVRIGAGVLLSFIPKCLRSKVRQHVLKKITRFNRLSSLEIAAIERMASLSRPFDKNMLDSYTYLPFEDGMFQCFSDWDDHLRRKFDDYMTLPPEHQRNWLHHPIILDFEHNYEELNQ